MLGTWSGIVGNRRLVCRLCVICIRRSTWVLRGAAPTEKTSEQSPQGEIGSSKQAHYRGVDTFLEDDWLDFVQPLY